MKKDKTSFSGEFKPKVIINKNKYLDIGLISEQLELGRITHINKSTCGNGATYSWLHYTPPATKTNIIIEPNVSTIQSKEKEHLSNQNQHNTRCFIYEGNPIDYSKPFNHLVMTSDAFVHNYKEIFSKFNIHSILIDEMHSVVQSSNYRRVMPRMMDVLLGL